MKRIIIVLMLAAALMALMWTACESQEAKQGTKLEDQVKDIQKNQNEIKEAVEGTNNTLETYVDNSKVTLNDIKKMVMNFQLQSQKSSSAQAEVINGLEQKVNNTHNSTILMIVINAFLVVIVLAQLGVIYVIVKRLIRSRARMRLAVASGDNDLDEGKLSALDKLNGL